LSSWQKFNLPRLAYYSGAWSPDFVARSDNGRTSNYPLPACGGHTR